MHERPRVTALIKECQIAHAQIVASNQAFPCFSTFHAKNHGKAWFEATQIARPFRSSGLSQVHSLAVPHARIVSVNRNDRLLSCTVTPHSACHGDASFAVLLLLPFSDPVLCCPR